MAPTELTEALAEKLQLQQSLADAGWCICGDMSSRMFDALSQLGEAPPIRFTGFTGSRGGNYAVITHQVGTSQHRFLLPLYDEKVGGFLRSLEDSFLQVSLGRQGQENALVLRGECPWSHVVPLMEMLQHSSDASVLSAIVEMKEVLAVLARFDAIPSNDIETAVDDLSISFVMPELLVSYIQEVRRPASGYVGSPS
ncbi:hypothetical protein JJQ59_04600 [Cupriavidus necator]|uniref:Uncharacterized protein n=1 Tax=Cupriavidus necator TaxID=106590 RepID=A0A367PQS3_CUPNE|nr:hypothetical protein [Cupriavidus necator]QQX85233.1 hypothetical protein JJQ59_04600 [Cupriavidus necator]RCJ10299.1 hypothetical protein DDK22_01190 [Cupriavidus necator]